MDLNEELLSLREKNRVLSDENKELKKHLDLLSERIKKLEEENQRIRDENQKLRLILFGLGHKGISRKKPDRVDKTVVLRLDACPHCNGELSELEQTREIYTEDIVPVTLYVTRYIIKQGYCKKCGKIVYPEVPEVIDNCHFGLHFLLYITYLRYVMNLPDNKIATLLNDIYDAKVSEGTIVEYLRRAARIFGAEYERIKKQMNELKTCHYDDTGQRVNGMNKWLWVFISNEVMLYYSSKSRSKKVIVEILGEDYNGVTVQDFFPFYDQAPGLKQKCWSHLIRDARDVAEKKKPPPDAKEFHEGLQQIYKDAKEAVKQLGTEEEKCSMYDAFVERLKNFANKGWQNYDVRRLAKRALKYSGELFTFVLIPGIEPTNNSAGQALIPCVVQNKIWGCHRTNEGAKNRDILMSVIGTMKQQGKSILTFGKGHILKALA